MAITLQYRIDDSDLPRHLVDRLHIHWEACNDTLYSFPLIDKYNEFHADPEFHAEVVSAIHALGIPKDTQTINIYVSW